MTNAVLPEGRSTLWMLWGLLNSCLDIGIPIHGFRRISGVLLSCMSGVSMYTHKFQTARQQVICGNHVYQKPVCCSSRIENMTDVIAWIIFQWWMKSSLCLFSEVRTRFCRWSKCCVTVVLPFFINVCQYNSLFLSVGLVSPSPLSHPISSHSPALSAVFQRMTWPGITLTGTHGRTQKPMRLVLRSVCPLLPSVPKWMLHTCDSLQIESSW